MKILPKNVIYTQQHTMNKRYQATMLLAVIGDSIGYRRGNWEFNKDGLDIHRQMMKLTQNQGVLKLQLNKRNFPYSDDTVMHFATAKALLQQKPSESLQKICQSIAKQYKACWKLMTGRAPGMTCKRSIDKLNEDGSNWESIKYQKNGGGCGASMRSACIGLVYKSDLQKLIEVSVESGRITHHNPLGFLGSVVSAYFTSLAIKGENPHNWLYLLFKQALPKTHEYVAKTRDAENNLKGGSWQKFEECWKQYAQKRKMSISEPSTPTFPEKYDVWEREEFYQGLAINGWPGALGVDSVIIAYDAFLYSGDNWQKLCLSSMLHGGDSDSTGTIAAAWFGALYGFKGVPEEHTSKTEGKQQALTLGTKLFQLSQNAK